MIGFNQMQGPFLKFRIVSIAKMFQFRLMFMLIFITIFKIVGEKVWIE